MSIFRIHEENIDNPRNIDEKDYIQSLLMIIGKFFVKNFESSPILIVFFGANKKVLS